MQKNGFIFNNLLNEKEYDVFCIFDADNLVEKNFLLEMNKQMLRGYRVIQGYIDSKNPFDSWITASYSIAFWTSNRLYQLPRSYLKMTCKSISSFYDFLDLCQKKEKKLWLRQVIVPGINDNEESNQ